jgi:hypothetical protein
MNFIIILSYKRYFYDTNLVGFDGFGTAGSIGVISTDIFASFDFPFPPKPVMDERAVGLPFAAASRAA